MAKDRERSGSAAGGSGPAPPPVGALPDMVRRMVTLGLSGFFTTEEALRRAVGDTIPKDWVDFAAEQSEKTRRDFGDAVAREVGKALEGVDLAQVLGQVLEDRTIEVSARVRLVKADKADIGTGSGRIDFQGVSFDLGDHPEDPDPSEGR